MKKLFLTFFLIFFSAVSIIATTKTAPATVDYKIPAGKVKIISYNVRQSGLAKDDGKHKWPNRRQATVNMLSKEAPSVFGVQEALDGQIKFIEKEFPQYGRIGVGRDDGKSEGEIMAIFYLKKYFDLLDSGTIWLSETPDEVSRGWDAACNRTLTWAEFQEKATGKNFYFFNTHLDHMGEAARRESVKLIAQFVKDKAGEQTPIIVGGDLNSSIDDVIFNPLKEFMAVSRDTAPTTDSKGTFNAFGRAPSTIAIDHFFSKNAVCDSYRTLTENYGAPFISDHYPIELVVTL